MQELSSMWWCHETPRKFSRILNFTQTAVSVPPSSKGLCVGNNQVFHLASGPSYGSFPGLYSQLFIVLMPLLLILIFVGLRTWNKIEIFVLMKQELSTWTFCVICPIIKCEQNWSFHPTEFQHVSYSMLLMYTPSPAAPSHPSFASPSSFSLSINIGLLLPFFKLWFSFLLPKPTFLILLGSWVIPT